MRVCGESPAAELKPYLYFATEIFKPLLANEGALRDDALFVR